MGSLKNEEEMEQMGEGWTKEAILYVNGLRKVLPDGLAHLTLLEYLRGNATFVWLSRKFVYTQTHSSLKILRVRINLSINQSTNFVSFASDFGLD